MTDIIVRRAAAPSAPSPSPAEPRVATSPSSGTVKARRTGGVLRDLLTCCGKPPKKSGVSISAPSASKTTPGVDGYVYLPFVGKDTVNSVVGEAMRRIAKGAQPYPVVVPNDAVAKAFHAAVEDYKRTAIAPMAALTAKGASKKPPPGMRASEFRELVEGCRLMERAIRNLQVLDAQATGTLAVLQPDHSKLYLDAHGIAGEDHVSRRRQDGSLEPAMSAQAVSAQLKESGLPSAFKDIRTKVCWSADRRVLTSFSPAERRATSTPDPTAAPEHQAPFGVHLANALHADGFTQAAVTGYHGQSLHLPRRLGQTFHAVQTTLDDGELQRRSAVKERFTAAMPPPVPGSESD